LARIGSPIPNFASYIGKRSRILRRKVTSSVLKNISSVTGITKTMRV
jgi:hypothetical protein